MARRTLGELLRQMCPRAKWYFQDGAGMVCARNFGRYHWLQYHPDLSEWCYAGSTLTKGRGVSKHRMGE